MTFFRFRIAEILTLRGLVVALPVLLLAGGCRGPSEIDRDNSRVVAEILTAITLKNGRLLSASATRAQARHDAGQLADADYQAMQLFIDKARAGNWEAAEADGYAFRKLHPFVPAGQ